MITIHQVQQGSDEWLAIREGKYTGSNAHKILKSKNAVTLMDGVAVRYSLGEITGFTGNYYTKRGHILEEQAIEIYEKIYGCNVQRPGFITNDLYETCGYSPDGIDGDTLIEVKCFNEKKHSQINKGSIPLEILAQIHFGLLITELKKARLILYNPELEPKKAFKTIDIKADRDIQRNFKNIIGASQ